MAVIGRASSRASSVLIGTTDVTVAPGSIAVTCCRIAGPRASGADVARTTRNAGWKKKNWSAGKYAVSHDLVRSR